MKKVTIFFTCIFKTHPKKYLLELRAKKNCFFTQRAPLSERQTY